MDEPIPKAQPARKTIANLPDEPLPAFSYAGFQAPADFGDYELLEELGRGGMGVVYQARQKDLDRLVAVKVILTGRLATPHQVQRFRDEARAAAKLQHPNVVHIYEAGEYRGNHFFAMEYIAGQSLAAVIELQRLNFEGAAELISTVAQAVEHLHTQGIVHRDLKPSNILIDKQDRPFVTDFGLAMMFHQETNVDTPNGIAGTPTYMAPEQVTGQNSLIGPRTDVYCLGAVLYHLLTNRQPYDGASSVDILVQVMENEPPRPRQLNPKIPPELELICLRCLEKHPDNRYPSAAALAADLDKFLRGEVIDSQTLGLWRTLQSWARRQPGLVARLGGFAACAVIAEVNYRLVPNVPPNEHSEVLLILALWSLVSLICQWLLDQERWSAVARWIWAAGDVILLTLMLRTLNATNSALVAGYAVAIAGAGLWVRERLVWLVTITSIAGYVVLVADGYSRQLPMPHFHWHPVFITLLVVLGWIVAFQVGRIRRLAKYYRRDSDKAL